MLQEKLWLPFALAIFALTHIWGASLLAQSQGQQNAASVAIAASRD
jgi:hypothetical protein